MAKRSAFDEYILGGDLEADAKKGVADAIADLIAAGITPVYSSTLTKSTPLQNPKDEDELVLPPTDK
jgi:hypothetical protein